MLTFGRQDLADLDRAAEREWLVTDGLGGCAMGTMAGLRTRRCHGLLVVATRPPGGRMLGLAALDPTVVIGDSRVRLAVHEWASGAVDPAGHLALETFRLEDGLPVWRWSLGAVVLERRVAMARARAAVAISHRVVRAPGAVRLQLSALCTWRDADGRRAAGPDPAVEAAADGFVFEGAYRVVGGGFRPAGEWYHGARLRAEAERGLPDTEDLWHAGDFVVDLEAGRTHEVLAWAGDLAEAPPPAAEVLEAAGSRAASLIARGQARDDVELALLLAADRFVVAGPAVVAGYPWLGERSRDALTAYEGLFLETGRQGEGRALLQRAAAALSEGMLPGSLDGGSPQHATADAALWLVHAIARHVQRDRDHDLARELLPALVGIVEHHLAGTRRGTCVDQADGLLAEGGGGRSPTWMDAGMDGHAVTPRAGKAVEVNALWINGLSLLAWLSDLVGGDGGRFGRLRDTASASFRRRFLRDGRCLDLVDGPAGDDPALRPNQLLAVSLPLGPLIERGVVSSCAPLVTSLGLRTLDPADPAYRGRQGGRPAERDAVSHQGAVWPWLIGPYAEAAHRCGMPVDGVLDGLEAHLNEWGLGSVSETASGDVPHAASGCPFQAWSVAELLRVRRLLRR